MCGVRARVGSRLGWGLPVGLLVFGVGGCGYGRAGPVDLMGMNGRGTSQDVIVQAQAMWNGKRVPYGSGRVRG